MAQLPVAWQEEFIARHARRNPDLWVDLRLCYDPNAIGDLLKRAGIAMRELQAELQTIVSFGPGHQKKQHADIPYFLQTPQLSVLVAHRMWDGRQVAQIRHIKPRASGLPGVGPRVSARVVRVWDADPFDLHEAFRQYEAAKPVARAVVREAAYGDTIRGPSRRLRDGLDRRLLPAQVIIDLVAKRESVVKSVRADGAVEATGPGEDGTPPATDVLRVRLDKASGALAEDADALLTEHGPDGEPAAEAIAVEVVDAADEVVLLRPKRQRDLARLPDVGTRVTIIREARPSVGRAMTDAITRIRAGNVAGDWDALARLLIEPGSLPAAQPQPARPQSPVSSGVKLSPEQASAVDRAVTAPHAFFIQGPPGTGKSTVITEVVRRLTARGERVLLAAPMHVAVDEVLSRLRDDPLVWPMRVAADPDNIREDLRYLHENQLGKDTAERISRRAGHAQGNWPAEIAHLRGRAEALSTFQDAMAASAQASREVGTLRGSGEIELSVAETARAEQDVAHTEQWIAAARAAGDAARAAAAESGQLQAQAEEAHRAAARALASAHEELRAAAHEAEQAEQAATGAHDDLDAITAHAQALDARLHEARNAITALADSREAAWRQATAAVIRYLAEAEDKLRQGDPAGDDGNIAVAERAVGAAQSSLHDWRRQQARSHERARASYLAAEQDHQLAARAAATAAAARAEYQQARERAGFGSRIVFKLGVGRVLALRDHADELADEGADAAARHHASYQAAVRARTELDNATARVLAAGRAVADAQAALRWATANREAEAAAFDRAVQALVTAREALARQDGLPGVLGVLAAVGRQAVAAAQSPLATPVSAIVSDAAAEAGRVAVAMQEQDETMATRIVAARDSQQRFAGAWDEAVAQRARLASGLEATAEHARQRQAALVAARAAHDAAVAAEQVAREQITRYHADWSRAQEQARAADAEIAGLMPAKTQRARDADRVRQRLAGVTARLAVLEARASDAELRLAQARRDATAACDGQLPADPASDILASQQRIDRVTALIRLEDRWRDMLAASAADNVDPAEQLGSAIVEATNLVCATVAGIAGSPAAKAADFDTLILDEASRVTDPEFLVPAVRARRWILVGDERQLPPYVDQEMEQHIHAMLALRAAEQGAEQSTAGKGTLAAGGKDGASPLEAALAALADAHDELLPRRPVRRGPAVDLATRMLADGTWAGQYRDDLDRRLEALASDLALLPVPKDPKGRGEDPEMALIEALAHGRSVSRFEQCVTLPEADGSRVRMTVQRRMIAPIAELVRMPVYHGEYNTPGEAELRAARVVPFTGPDYEYPVTFFDTQRSAQGDRLVGTGFVNDYEADLVVSLLHTWDDMAGQGGHPARPSFSVLTFYKAQAALIERRLARRPLRRLDKRVIDSVDKIQGQESDLVVISFVRAKRVERDGRRLYARTRHGTYLWLQDIHRLNVAVTRAKLALALVGDGPTLRGLSGNAEAEAFYANLFRLVLGDGKKRRPAPGFGYVGDAGV